MSIEEIKIKMDKIKTLLKENNKQQNNTENEKKTKDNIEKQETITVETLDDITTLTEKRVGEKIVEKLVKDRPEGKIKEANQKEGEDEKGDLNQKGKDITQKIEKDGENKGIIEKIKGFIKKISGGKIDPINKELDNAIKEAKEDPINKISKLRNLWREKKLEEINKIIENNTKII